MEVLSIGNSFSEDSHRYLHGIAKSEKFAMNTYNLYIGGCSLEHHYRNMLSAEKEYELQINGVGTKFYVSLDEALTSRKWDIITLQQVSNEAANYETYQPYLSELAKYVRVYQPKAQIAFHETWAYENDSQCLCNAGYKTSKDMFCDIEKSVKNAFKDIEADFIIPSGAVMYKLLEMGKKVHRDTFHASLGLGRYALGLLWYAVLTGNDIDNCDFDDFDEKISQTDIKFIKQCIRTVMQEKM